MFKISFLDRGMIAHSNYINTAFKDVPGLYYKLFLFPAAFLAIGDTESGLYNSLSSASFDFRVSRPISPKYISNKQDFQKISSSQNTERIKQLLLQYFAYSTARVSLLTWTLI